MHDFAVSRQIAREVIARAKTEGAERVLEVRIKIGELTHLNPEQVNFWLEQLFKGTPAEDARILIDKICPLVWCRKCGYEGELALDDGFSYSYPQISVIVRCPECGSDKVDVKEGRECLLQRIKIQKAEYFP